jgi:DNA repair protein RecN (Recombination protein N)
MIRTIQIKNYSLIEDSTIELNKGLNIITGETGAGKSLFISAISLLLGEKVDTKLIKNKDKETSVLIEIDSTHYPNLKKYLLDNEIEDDNFILKRTFSNSSSRNFINNQPTSIQIIKELMRGLFFVASQNESSEITDKERQHSVIEGFLPLDKRKYFKEFNLTYKEYKNLQKELDETKEKTKSKDFNLDYLEYQYQEIKESDISEDDLAIIDKISELKKKEELKSIFESLDPLIHGEDSVVGKIRDLLYYVEKLENKNIVVSNKETLLEAKAIVDAFIKENKNELTAESDEENLSALTERYESLSKILRKYGPTIEDVLQKKEELHSKISIAKNIDNEILKIEKAISKKYEECLQKAQALRKLRNKTIPKIEENVTQELQDLNMKGAEFKIKLSETPLNSHGIDSVEFLIKPHAGQEPLPISKIASGGELSRILLAINSVIETSGCFLFDEIDSGIGGNTGLKIGEKLSKMGNKNQIICITHLHQVAVYADKHFKIEKTQVQNKTTTSIVSLKAEEIETEISRMLGDDLSKNSILHAKDLIKNAKNKRAK